MSVPAVVDEVESLSLKITINNHHIFFAIGPFVIPQNAPNAVPILKLFEFLVLCRVLKLYQNALPLFETVELVLPDLQLLSHRCETLITAQPEKVADFDLFELLKVRLIHVCADLVLKSGSPQPLRIDVMRLFVDATLLGGYRLLLFALRVQVRL